MLWSEEHALSQANNISLIVASANRFRTRGAKGWQVLLVQVKPRNAATDHCVRLHGVQSDIQPARARKSRGRTDRSRPVPHLVLSVPGTHAIPPSPSFDLRYVETARTWDGRMPIYTAWSHETRWIEQPLLPSTIRTLAQQAARTDTTASQPRADQSHYAEPEAQASSGQ